MGCPGDFPESGPGSAIRRRVRVPCLGHLSIVVSVVGARSHRRRAELPELLDSDLLLLERPELELPELEERELDLPEAVEAAL